MKLTILLLTTITTGYAQPQYYPFLSPVPERITIGTASPIGTPGTATYYYWVVAKYPVGDAFPGGPFAIFNASNTLSINNYVRFSFGGTGATSYDILRTPTAFMPASGNCVACLVGNIAITQANDQGGVLTDYTLNTTSSAIGTILLNNKDYVNPRFVFSPNRVQSLQFGQVCFDDLTCQTSASAGGTVASVFGRVGNIVATTNDYNFNQLAGNATVVQGGTGFTSYTKGDVLCAVNATTLAKLGVGTDTFVLTSDSSQSCGVRWNSPGSGSVTSIGVSVPSFMGISPASITTNGTFAFTFNSQIDGLFLGSPNGGGVPSFRTIPYASIAGTPTSLPPSGACSGDLGGTFPSCTVAKINGTTLDTMTPTLGRFLAFDGTNAVSVAMNGDATIGATGTFNLAAILTSGGCGDATHSCQLTYDTKGRITAATNVVITGSGGGGPPTGAAGGDLSNTYPNPTVAKINGSTLGTTTPNDRNILIADGSAWNSRAMSGDGTIGNTGILNVTKVNGTTLNLGTPTAGNVVIADGANYVGRNIDSLPSSSISAALDPAGHWTMYYNRVLDVQQFGALNDCTGNSTSAFQLAIDTVQNKDPEVSTTGTGGGIVAVPPGCYNIAGTLTLGNGSAISENTYKPVFIWCISAGSGDTDIKTKTCELRWTGGNQGSTTYMFRWNGPYTGGGIEGFFVNMQNATNVLAFNAVQVANQQWKSINIWQGASGPQITCTTIKPNSHGCFQASTLIDINVNNPGTNGEGIFLTGTNGNGDTHGAKFIGGNVYGMNYGLRLGFADNNMFERMEFHTVNAGSSTVCSIKFDRDASPDAAFPHENNFYAVSPASGICGKMGNGLPNTFITLNLGDCSSNCDPSALTDGTELIALDTSARNFFGLGNLTLISASNGLPAILARVPNSVGGTELWRLGRGGVSGNGATMSTLDDFLFTNPNAIYHNTNTATNSSFIGTLYSSSAASDRYAWRLRRARGTIASPSSIVSGDRNGLGTFEGYANGDWRVGAVISSVSTVVSGANLTNNLKLSTAETGTLHDIVVLNSYGGLELGYGRTKAELDTLAGSGLTPNGSMWYCTNCLHTSPTCDTTLGVGAFAKRLNGAWVCN